LGKLEGKRPLGRPRRRWDDNIRIELQEVEWGGGAWTGFIWLKIGTGSCKRGEESPGSINCEGFLD
jgi:hypothetical protein